MIIRRELHQVCLMKYFYTTSFLLITEISLGAILKSFINKRSLIKLYPNVDKHTVKNGEYDFAIALDRAKRDENGNETITFPSSCVVYVKNI